ncbi:MAG: ATP-binding protein [Calditrichia bacterium]
MAEETSQKIKWWLIIAGLVILVTVLHYSTPTMKWQYHLIFMQSYFIPIILGAFQFGIRGGLGTAIAVSFLYFPHIMLQWGGLVEGNLMRFLQIVLFNVIGYLTGLKAQNEKEEKSRYQNTAEQLEKTLQKIREQSVRIEEMEDQLRQADRLAVVGELSASLAHEVRNPLGSIRGIVDILKDELPTNKEMANFLNIMVQETERLNEVVENYLRFAGQKSSQVISFDIREIIKNTELLLANRARKNQITIKTRLPEKELPLTGVPGQLQQVLMNLALNSIQAMPDGGDLSVEVERLGTKSQDGEKASDSKNTNKIRISISDNGKGISEPDIERIFKPFYTTRQDGTGLGLAIVKRIIDQNNWRIEVESEINKGSIFSIYIPIEENNEKTK